MDEILKTTPEFAGTILQIKQALNDARIVMEHHVPSISNERYYTGEELCRILHLSKRTLQNYRDDGTLPFTRIGDKILYRDSDIA